MAGKMLNNAWLADIMTLVENAKVQKKMNISCFFCIFAPVFKN